MLRRFIAAAGLALALAGCATSGGGSSVTPSAIVAEAQKIAVTTCSFLPTASTVMNIFLSGNAALQTGEAIAAAICGAVGRKSVQRGDASAPTVAGVVIHGRFVR